MMRTLTTLIAFIIGICVLTNTFAESSVVNDSGQDVWVMWRAFGCAGITSYGEWGMGFVCKHERVSANSTGHYKFKWGTTLQDVYIFGGDSSNKSSHISYYRDWEHAKNKKITLHSGWRSH